MLFEVQDLRSCEYTFETQDTSQDTSNFSKNRLTKIFKRFRICCIDIKCVISEAVMSLSQAPGYQARLSSKSDMINTRRGDATIGSSRQMDRYLIYHYRES